MISCAVCAGPLTPSGACLRCLLRAGLEEPEAATGYDSAVYGDFEIARRDDGTLWELGRGAMGVTYRAADKVLHRNVALKIIEPPASVMDSQVVRERFLREARAAAALRHPNIAGVFQFGSAPEVHRCYCAMELVEGETLEARVRREGPLKVDVALDIAIQVTRALLSAAERGLVHRDLKPGNIMLARSDDPARIEVKVIDFGLAKAASAAGEMELTHGGFVGTPAFASPEQFAGGAIDGRSDIYALGVTLWFSLTGRLPFAGTTMQEIRDRQAHHPLPLEQLRSKAVPASVITLVRSCLAADPDERPSSAGELMQELEACRQRKPRRRAAALLAAALVCLAGASIFFWRSHGATPALAAPAAAKSVAILPFENLSPDAADAFFVDGIQDDILTSIGKIKDLKVIARSSVMDYRGARRSGALREIGRTLGGSHVVEGSVRRVADRVVVSVALIDTRNEHQVWSERYDRTLTNTLSLQGELAVEIARALHASLTPLEHTVPTAKPTENAEAYILYLRGRETETRDQNTSDALRLYEEAVRLDPNFALAHARLSICASYLIWENAGGEWKTKARSEAEAALGLQPSLGEARLALSLYYSWGENDPGRALAEVEQAAELLPNSEEVPLAAAFIHKLQNRYRDRLADLERAEALDPRNRRVLYFSHLLHHWTRNWTESRRSLERAAAVASDADNSLKWEGALANFNGTSDTTMLDTALVHETSKHGAAEPKWLKFAYYSTAMLERDYAAAARWLAATSDIEVDQIEFNGPKAFQEALLAVARDDDPAVRQAALSQAREDIRHRLTAIPDISPTITVQHIGDAHTNAEVRANLAIVQALLGDKEDAITSAVAVVDQYPGLPDSIEKNQFGAALAVVYAQTGEPEKAVDLLEHLLTVPAELPEGCVYNVTLAELQSRWVWDPLRSNSRFQKLVAGPEPATSF